MGQLLAALEWFEARAGERLESFRRASTYRTPFRSRRPSA